MWVMELEVRAPLPMSLVVKKQELFTLSFEWVESGIEFMTF